MTPFTPLLIVTSLYEVFIEWMEYDDTFHTSAHCDLTDWSIYLVNGYDDTFHTSAHCDLTVWSIYWVNGVRWLLSHLCSLWTHCTKYLLSEWSVMTPFIPLLIVTSLTEVYIESMEYDDTFHNSAPCDLTVLSIYWVNGVRWHLSHLCSFWHHCIKYLLSEWSMMTPFIPLLIVTSLTEVYI